MKFFDSKNDMRAEFESKTDPERPIMEQAESISSSTLLASTIGVRNGLKMLKDYLALDTASEKHDEIRRRTVGHLSERMTAFELELINAIVDLSWELHECGCDKCVQIEAAMDIDAQMRNARFN